MDGGSKHTRSWRARTSIWLSGGMSGSREHAVATVLIVAAISVAVTAAVLVTVPGQNGIEQQLLNDAITASGVFFLLEYAGRIWTAPEQYSHVEAGPWHARRSYMLSFLGLIDLMVIMPLAGSIFVHPEPELFNLVLLLSQLKLARYARTVSLFVAVFRNEGRALLSGMTGMLMLMVLVSGVMFVLEHDAQPNVFRSIPDAMWWAIVTMATVGYGDITPITPLGKLFGGFTMLLGVAMFAIPAGILANGFATEIRKRDFVVTWQTVASLPLFASLDASRIATIASLLKTEILPARQVVVRRGEPADAMFFIMSGEVEVDVPTGPKRMGKGQYFGEIALIKDTVRTATVTTLRECRLLLLDVADFRRLMTQYPELKAAIEKVAEERLRNP
jgi:voltage-gated potassium channel